MTAATRRRTEADWIDQLLADGEHREQLISEVQAALALSQESQHRPARPRICSLTTPAGG